MEIVGLDGIYKRERQVNDDKDRVDQRNVDR